MVVIRNWVLSKICDAQQFCQMARCSVIAAAFPKSITVRTVSQDRNQNTWCVNASRQATAQGLKHRMVQYHMQ